MNPSTLLVSRGLSKILDETTYNKLIESDKAMVENQNAIIKNSPLKIFVG